MALDVVSYVLSMGYTSSSLDGAGALKGEQGESAYEIAKRNGFVGTEAEWLESLKADANELETIVQQKVADATQDLIETEDIDFTTEY